MRTGATARRAPARVRRTLRLAQQALALREQLRLLGELLLALPENAAVQQGEWPRPEGVHYGSPEELAAATAAAEAGDGRARYTVGARRWNTADGKAKAAEGKAEAIWKAKPTVEKSDAEHFDEYFETFCADLLI